MRYNLQKSAMAAQLACDVVQEKVSILLLYKEGKLNKVPKVLLTLKTMLEKDHHDGSTPLHAAAFYGHLDQVPKELLTLETLLTKDKTENTPLHWAAWSGQLLQVPELSQAAMLARNNVGVTPLHLAAMRGHLAQVPKRLLLLEAMLTKDNAGSTPLHEAAYGGCLAQVPEELLTTDTVLLMVGDESLLLCATRFGYLNHVPKRLLTVQTLLAQDSDGDTALHWATKYGYLDALLGVDFGVSDSVKKVVGEEWWMKNLEVLRQMQELELGCGAPEIDLF